MWIELFTLATLYGITGLKSSTVSSKSVQITQITAFCVLWVPFRWLQTSVGRTSNRELQITEAYGDFLFAAARISNGEIRIDGYHSDVDHDTFTLGTGAQEVFFNLNGKPYTFSAQFYYDWLDCAIIDYVNDILEEQGIASRLWCMYDGEQGFVVLCNTAEWAQTFSKRTNYPLALKANEAMKIFSSRG